MKVIIATTITPFSYGGATLLVDWLEEALVNRGHQVEMYKIPLWGSPTDLPQQILGLRNWDFTGHGDRLITVRTPSYLIRHHSKVAWFLHHHRLSYDLWETYPDVPDDASGAEFRRLNFASDDVALRECERLFTNSQTISNRLTRYNQLDSEVLYPPLGEGVTHSTGPAGDHLLYVSRVVPHKRQLLAVQAMQHTSTDVRLTIAGGSGHDAYADSIKEAIVALSLQDKVTYLDRVVSDTQKDELQAGALGVIYIPLDEDSYGFVGLEAVAARKPLVTVTDAGGSLELVKDGVNGLVADPTPESLAAAFDRLYSDKQEAVRMGAAQQGQVERMNISWDHIVERLLG